LVAQAFRPAAAREDSTERLRYKEPLCDGHPDYARLRAGTDPDTRDDMHTHRLAACCAFAVVTTGCAWAWPQTDIVGVSTEDIGDYAVTATATGDTVTATVCVDQPDNDAAIAARIAHELYGKGYRSMRFDMVPAGSHADADVTHVAWTSDRGMQVTGHDRTNVPECGVPDPPSRVGVIP
jgi:hypothetical protein